MYCFFNQYPIYQTDLFFGRISSIISFVGYSHYNLFLIYFCVCDFLTSVLRTSKIEIILGFIGLVIEPTRFYIASDIEQKCKIKLN